MTHLKTDKEAKYMIEGGKILGRIRNTLADRVAPGVTGIEIDSLAQKLIREAGAEISFTMEPNYHWATCIDVNDGVVHGIPTDYQFRDGDIVGIDVGLKFKGFHTDTATTVGVGQISPKNKRFLDVGKETLNAAVNTAKPGRRIYDISLTIEGLLKKAGYSPVAALAGHGVGLRLHEDPLIPCVAVGDAHRSPKLSPGMTLAIEVIYTAGSGEVAYGGPLGASGTRLESDDGWTIVSLDGTIAAVFEDSILVTEAGSRVLTRGN